MSNHTSLHIRVSTITKRTCLRVGRRRLTGGEDVVSADVDVDGLDEEKDDELGAVVHGGVVHQGQALLVLLAEASPGHLARQGLEHGHQPPLGRRLQTRPRTLTHNTQSASYLAHE